MTLQFSTSRVRGHSGRLFERWQALHGQGGRFPKCSIGSAFVELFPRIISFCLLQEEDLLSAREI